MSKPFDRDEDLAEKLLWDPTMPAPGADGSTGISKGSRPRSRARGADAFAIVPLSELTAGVGVLDSAAEMAVWIYILREWRMKSWQPVAVTNVGLAAWGIHRRTKYRALVKLANAGLIRVESQGKKSPLVLVCHGR